MQNFRFPNWHLRLQSLTSLMLFLGTMGLMAWLTHHYRYEQDWTDSQRNSLAPATQKLLKNTKQAIHFIAFVNSNPALHARIRGQLVAYRHAGHGTSLSFSNPDLDPQLAQKYGISHAGQMAIQIGAHHRIVDNLSQQTIANAIMQLDHTGSRWVVFLNGQEERNPQTKTSEGMSRLAAKLQQTGLKVQPINLLRTPGIPENTATLVIAGPKTDFTPGETGVIMRYIRQGGDLLWLHDPGSDHGLDVLSKIIGLRFLPGTVVDANPELRAMIGIQNPAVVPVLNYGSSPITSHLQVQTLMPFTAAIAQPAGSPAWHAVPLLHSLPKSWSETAPLKGHVEYDPAHGDTQGPLVLGEAFSRELRNGHQQRIVVFGTSAFASNAFIGNGANLDLSVAAINWLSHDDSLVSIHLPSSPDIRLTLGRKEGYTMALIFLIMLPAGYLLAAFLIRSRRRRASR